MITLTQAATERLKKLFQSDANYQGFRIAIKPAGCSGYKYVTEMVTSIYPTDKKIEIEQMPIFIDKTAVAVLQGAELDCVNKGLAAWQWEFHNPNVINNCGCGESFSVKEAKS